MTVEFLINYNICEKFERRTVFWWVINGYPLRPFLKTPVFTVNSIEEKRLNFPQCYTQVQIENVFDTLKTRLPCLRKQDRLKQTNVTVITACCVLYNIARYLSLPLPNDYATEPQSERDGPSHISDSNCQIKEIKIRKCRVRAFHYDILVK